MTPETTKKGINIFDHLKNITTEKGDFLGDEGWNNRLINRWLSFEESYCDAVNTVQKNTWQMKGEYLYNLYRDLIPKKKVFLKYIKATNPKKYKDIEVESVQKYFEISKKEAKEYIDMLPESEIEFIVQQIKGK
jgi:hypothetical protein